MTDAYHMLSVKMWMVSEYHMRRFGAFSSRGTNEPYIPCTENMASIVVWTNMDGFIYPRHLLGYIHRQHLATQRGQIHGHCLCTGKCAGLYGPPPYRDPECAQCAPRFLIHSTVQSGTCRVGSILSPAFRTTVWAIRRYSQTTS
jgi:hypothetical protein